MATATPSDVLVSRDGLALKQRRWRAVGRVRGEIATERRGSNGFGFDPVMFIPQFGKTFAELPVEVKNANSHRGQAARQMLALMQERWFA